MGIDRVLIVGGGIGGLTLARALERQGVPYLIAERANELRAVGAGITLSAGAVRLLAELGVQLGGIGTELGRLDVTDERGNVLSTGNVGEILKGVGPSYALHRHELHEALREGLAPERFRLGTEVTHVREMGQGVDAELGGAARERFAIVIGADGIRSAVRKTLSPHLVPKYAGYTCWRSVVDLQVTSHCVELWGRGRRFGIVPLSKGRTYFFATHNVAANTADPVEGRCARLRELFAGFPYATALLEVAKDEEILHGDIEDVLARRWAVGRIGLLGDAAHASTPNLGLGATLAIEDAYVLAQELSNRGLNAEALVSFQRRRFERAAGVQRSSRRMGQIAQWEQPFAISLRNFVMKKTPQSKLRSVVLETTLAEPSVATLVGAPMKLS